MGYKRGMKAGLSIVVPLYNEAKGLARLHAQLSDVARKLSEKRDLGVEVVYVDDGSSDDTLKIARALPAAALDVQVLAPSAPLRIRPLDFDGARLGPLVERGLADGRRCIEALGYST